MKGFDRENQWFSLCGLNCGLCPMFIGHYCPGCGGGEGNQSCKIARCGLDHGVTDYCFRCAGYPCQFYDRIDDYDSFITHRRRRVDMARAQEIGLERYTEEQREKAAILAALLEGYNDGRRKSFYCLAVNLLDLPVLRRVMEALEGLSLKEGSALAVRLLQEAAEEAGVSLKLRRKK